MEDRNVRSFHFSSERQKYKNFKVMNKNYPKTSKVVCVCVCVCVCVLFSSRVETNILSYQSTKMLIINHSSRAFLCIILTVYKLDPGTPVISILPYEFTSYFNNYHIHSILSSAIHNHSSNTALLTQLSLS